MAITNPIKSTSRTFEAVIADADNDQELKNKPNWFKTLVAGVADQLNTQGDLLHNESILGTAKSYDSIADHISLINYYLSPPTTSKGNIAFYLDRSLSGSQVFASATLLSASTIGTLNNPSLPFIPDSIITHNIIDITFTVSGSIFTVSSSPETGEVIRVSSTGSLPTPLLVNTDYYIIKVSDTTFKVASTMQDSFDGSEITLTTAGTGTLTYRQYSFVIISKQQTKLVAQTIGEGDGSDFQEFEMSEPDIIADTVVCFSGANTYTRVINFGNTSETDFHFVTRRNSQGVTFIQFGGNGFGVPPGVGTITSDYSTGGGILSNVVTIGLVNVYTGGDSRILSCSNIEIMTGGANEENAEQAKIIAPLLLSAQDRFVKTIDGVALTLANFAVSQVVINTNFFGPLTCRVSIVPISGGAPSGAILSDLQTFLIERSPLESFGVVTASPVYQTINSTSSLKVKSGYTYATVEEFYKLAWFLLFADTGQEIKNEFEQLGILSAITLINLYHGSSFDAEDATQISTLLENLEPSVFEKSFQNSDIQGFIDIFVDGVDYFTFTAPVLPITLTGIDMTQSGTIGVTPL